MISRVTEGSKEEHRHKVADGSDLVAAAAIPLGYGTSHQALVHRANLKSGQVLLVLGAAGGVGLSAVQIGKIIGATVIAVARGPEKVEFLQSMGADHVVDLSKGGLIENVRAFLKTKNIKGVDVLYDPVGGKLTKESMKLLAWGAQILVIGFASGDVPLIPANIALVKNWTIHGFYLRNFEAVKPGVTEESTNELLSWLARGLFKVNISHSYKLQEVNRAFLDIKNRKAIGKVMIIFDDPKSISYLLGENEGVNVGNLVQVRDLVILRNGFGDIYQYHGSAKELWDSLETKYMVEDVSSKKFPASIFFNYKTVDSRPVMEQYNELLRILDFKHTLKHNKDELTHVELGSHLRIEESLKARELTSQRETLMMMLYGGLTLELQSMRVKIDDGSRHDRVKDFGSLGLKGSCKTFGLRFRNGRLGSLLLDFRFILKAFWKEFSMSLGGSFGDFGIALFLKISSRFYVIERHEFFSINSIIESRDAIFDENIFSSIPRPSHEIPNKNGSDDIGDSEDDPKTFDETMKSYHKRDSIMRNNTSVLADQPPGFKPLSFKWIFKKKMKVHGTIEKFKARLVIQGFKQNSGINYFDNYAPVTRISTIRLMIALASIHNLIVHQMDVKTTILNGELDEENQSSTLQTLSNHKICNIGFTHYPIHTITQDNQNRDLDLKRREEKSLIYNTSFPDEYECSSLALDRRMKKVEDEI
ncbi:quinone oxidoreductase-like protein 2 [Tanacetum coccineum]|uniref:Quinone oxidoreductase-like protein 2 n=1 Tax=Tanacetum coccineum TaxID=301880 RepID=A0ABQ4YMZ5_9ASTR